MKLERTFEAGLEHLRSGRLLRPFDLEIDVGRYWLTRLKSRRTTAALRAFRDWLIASHGP